MSILINYVQIKMVNLKPTLYTIEYAKYANCT